MKKYIFLLTVLMLTACGHQTSQAEKDFNNLRQQVFTEHDELMKDMIKGNSLLQKIEDKTDNLDEEKQLEFKRSAQHLKHAHTFMMSWMHSFDKAFPNINNKDTTYTDKEYKERTERMEGHQKVLMKVKEDMDSSISEAQDLLSEKT